MTGANRFEFLWKLRAHPLLARLLAVRKRLDKDVTVAEVAMLQKTANEALGLSVFAEQNNSDTHSFQPREIVSESESPSII